MKKMKTKSIVWLGLWLLFLYGMGLLFGRYIPKTNFILAVVNHTVYEQKAADFQRIEAFKPCKDQIQVLNSVAGGQADAGLADQLIALHLIHQRPEFRNLRLAGDLLDQEAAGVAFNVQDDSLRQAINRGLTEIVANGIYESISIRYFGRNVLPKSNLPKTYPDQDLAEDGSWKKIRLADELRFAMTGDNPPFCYLDDRKQLTGFDVEVAREVCIQLGIKEFTPILVKESDLFEGLIHRKYDGIWNSMRITKNNLSKADFSNPYYVTGAQLIVRKNSPITGPETFIPLVSRKKSASPVWARRKG
jgi:ABC-type amino acid transport substrate-binding protein